MVRKIYLYVMLWGAVIAQVMGQPKFSSEEVNAMMRKVADWQIANLKEGVEHDDLDWRRAVLYMGMVDWAELVEKKEGNSAYYQWLLRLGRKNHFQMGKWLYHADCIAVGQPFIDLYLRYGDKIMLGPVMSRADWIVANPSHTPMMLDYGKIETLYRWTWCDALFMAPPVYAKLYALSGDRKYLNFMDKEYRASYAYLYDKQDHLFYRDGTYFGKKEAMVRKCFGDVEMDGSWEVWLRFFRCFHLMILFHASIRICLWNCPDVLRSCSVRTVIGMPVCWTRPLIRRQKQVPPD